MRYIAVVAALGLLVCVTSSTTWAAGAPSSSQPEGQKAPPNPAVDPISIPSPGNLDLSLDLKVPAQGTETQYTRGGQPPVPSQLSLAAGNKDALAPPAPGRESPSRSAGTADLPVDLFLKDAPVEPAAGGGDSAELAKKLSNPIANLISVPLQFNYDKGYGPRDANKYTLIIQPVIPITLNEDWNLIVRTILPVVYRDSPAHGVNSQFGLGDTVQSFFFSPKAPTAGGWIWGAGPVFLWPTATDDSLGSQKWGAGPTGLILKQDRGWTYGILANHIWSYAGDDKRDEFNTTFVQPFVSYTWPTATTLGLNTESVYDWKAHQWTVPVNLAVSQIVKIGKLPVQFSLGGRYYAVSPDGGPEWGIRFTITFLFPK